MELIIDRTMKSMLIELTVMHNYDNKSIESSLRINHKLSSNQSIKTKTNSIINRAIGKLMEMLNYDNELFQSPLRILHVQSEGRTCIPVNQLRSVNLLSLTRKLGVNTLP